jgi:hypothetical protein
MFRLHYGTRCSRLRLPPTFAKRIPTDCASYSGVAISAERIRVSSRFSQHSVTVPLSRYKTSHSAYARLAPIGQYLAAYLSDTGTMALFVHVQQHIETF